VSGSSGRYARTAPLILLLVLAVCPYFVDLDGSSIWDANEAFYVETPREMMERGDYVNPTFNYEPRINKPVLSYWIVAGFYHLFGVSPGVQRIPIAIGGVLLVAIAFLLARAAAPPEHRVAAAWWAAIGLAISPRLLMFARRIFIDIYISLFMALTLLCFALAERYPSRRRLFLVLMYVSVGLGVLTKGPIAALLPGLVFAFYLLLHRELGRVREMLIPAGIVIVFAIVAPWYVTLYLQSGWEPIKSFIVGENLNRYVEGAGVNADHRGPFFYLPVVFSDSFPWSLLLIPAAVMWRRERRRPGALDGPDGRVRTLLWLWIFVIVLFFSLSAGKQDLYIFPIVPAVAALGALSIARVLDPATQHGAPSIRVPVWVMGGVLVVMGAAFLVLFQSRYAVYVLAGSGAIGVVAMIGGAAAIVYAVRHRFAPALMAVAIALLLANWIFVVRLLPSFEAYKPAPGLAAALLARADPDDLIVTYNVALPSLVYYLRRHTEVFYDNGPVLELIRSRRPMYLMMTSYDYEEKIAPALSEPLCRVTSVPTFDVKLRNVLSRRRLPEVLLLTNECPEAGARSTASAALP
jgi:4-amino-4-deoxy-L-arabinose transferase-like glycosyltransferase